MATVAREAGVAVSTVSAVLSNKSHCYASEETCERVRYFVEKLGYRPNRFARSLRGGKTNFIGAIFPELTGPMLMKVSTLESIAYKEGYRTIFGTHRGDPKREREYLFEFLANNFDGIILNSNMDNNVNAVKKVLKERHPFVTIESPYEFMTPGVLVDRELGGYLQVKHIMQDAGRKRIAFLRGSMLWKGGQAKIAGNNKAIEEVGSAVNEHIYIDRPNVNPNPYITGMEMAKELLGYRKKFDAIVTTSDSLALGIMHVLAQEGLKVPDDVAVVGFDDEDFSAALPIPLTTIHQPRNVGLKAYELLKHYIESGMPSEPDDYTQIMLKPHLVVRNSTIWKNNV